MNILINYILFLEVEDINISSNVNYEEQATTLFMSCLS